MQDQEICVVWSRSPAYRFMPFYLLDVEVGINPRAEMLLGMGVEEMFLAKLFHTRACDVGFHLSASEYLRSDIVLLSEGVMPVVYPPKQ